VREVVVRIENLHFSYDNEVEVLKGIDLEIRRGEIVSIMGENGAGKTTLIKHLNGLLKPRKGRVEVLGMDTRTTPVAKLARHVGMVFQNPDFQLFAETVENELLLALKNFGFPPDVAKRRAIWAMKIFGLERYKDRSPYTLSIGERKRLCIAAVLCYDPDIIVLDEPTSGQDFLQKEKIMEILYLLKQQGKTVILVTHDVEFVVRRSDRVVIMCDGKILADGSTREVLGNIEILRAARLKPPQIVETAHILYSKGLLDSQHVPLTPYELAREITGE